MLKEKTKQIFDLNRNHGWVLEPDAKALMKAAGLDIPNGIVTESIRGAKAFYKASKTPVVTKAVSTKILHKTEYNAVVTGIDTSARLESEIKRLMTLPGCSKVLVEEMVPGVEVIIGGKIDYQFGPVVVFGTGGTGVEIYNDTAIRLAPLKPNDVYSMVDSLVARQIVTGHRGKQGINMERLIHTLIDFSHLLMDVENQIESIDLNPVMCTNERCVVADARIILSKD